MKKPYQYFELSDKHRCSMCGRGIKKNLIHRKAGVPTLCYYDYKRKKDRRKYV